MNQFLSIVAALIIAGCASCPPHVKVGMTPEPDLIDIPPYDLALEQEPPLEVRLYLEEFNRSADEGDQLVLIRKEALLRPIYQCADNDVAYSEALDLCRSRIRLHDQSIDP